MLLEETKRREEGLRVGSLTTQESVPSINATEDLMETIEEENNTPHSLNRSFSFVSLSLHFTSRVSRTQNVLGVIVMQCCFHRKKKTQNCDFQFLSSSFGRNRK